MIPLYICSDILPSLAAYRDMTKNCAIPLTTRAKEIEIFSFMLELRGAALLAIN